MMIDIFYRRPTCTCSGRESFDSSSSLETGNKQSTDGIPERLSFDEVMSGRTSEVCKTSRSIVSIMKKLRLTKFEQLIPYSHVLSRILANISGSATWTVKQMLCSSISGLGNTQGDSQMNSPRQNEVYRLRGECQQYPQVHRGLSSRRAQVNLALALDRASTFDRWALGTMLS